MVCPEIHGESGLDAIGSQPFPPLSPALVPVPGKAVAVLAETILHHHTTTGEKVTIIATGALTNLALLLSIYPEVVPAIAGITTMGGAIGLTMGGAIGLGNTSPAAEFNVELDPEAYNIVLASGLPLTLVPLEVTHTALVTSDTLARVGTHTPFRALLTALLLFFRQAYAETFAMPEPPLHDPCAVLLVVAPELFTIKTCGLHVETASPVCAGRTVFDMLGVRNASPLFTPASVAVKMDVEAFWTILLEAVTTADAVSVMNKQL